MKAHTYGGSEMSRSLRIGIVGDYDPGRLSHVATDEAIRHAAQALGLTIDAVWVPTLSLEGQRGGAALSRFAALWCAPGAPYKSMEGALRAIRYARERGRPFIGT
jgi:CTP synthase (UTP-ammonia lyase)